MGKCACGHRHCCHNSLKSKIIDDENEMGFKIRFRRWTCAVCGIWISDEAI